MRDYTCYFKDAGRKDMATFADGFLAALAVYDIRCPEDDDPDSIATQGWIKTEVYKAQMAYELQQREDAKMINHICGQGKPSIREVVFAEYKDYKVDKYELIAMLMDCAYADEFGNEVDAEGNPVSAEDHKPWPQIVYHHTGNGSELSHEDYEKLPSLSRDQYEPIRYVEETDATGRKVRVCEDNLHLIDLIEDLIVIGDPVNERLYRHTDLTNMLFQRFRYDLPTKIRLAWQSQRA